MRGRAAFLALVVLAGTATASAAQSNGTSCSSFPNQAAAQAAFRANPAGNRGLDRDHDGVACESLPCPCDPPQASRASTGTNASTSPTSAPVSSSTFVYTAPTLPAAPAVPTAAPASVIAASATALPRGVRPVLVSGLQASLPSAPPRDPAAPTDDTLLASERAAPPPAIVAAPPAAPVAAPPAPLAGELGFVELADTWSSRAGVLTVHADGRAQALWLDSATCRSEAGACDTSASALGGRASLSLRQRDGSSVIAEVESSSQEAVLPLGVAILRLRPDGVLELWPAGQDLPPRVYCNERLRQTQPALAREQCGG